MLYHITQALTVQEWLFPHILTKTVHFKCWYIWQCLDNGWSLLVVKIRISFTMSRLGQFSNLLRGILYFPSCECICHACGGDWLFSKSVSLSSWSFPDLQQVTVASGLGPGQGKVGLTDVQRWSPWLLKASHEILLFSLFSHLLTQCPCSERTVQQMRTGAELPSVWSLNYFRKQSQASQPCFLLGCTWGKKNI